MKNQLNEDINSELINDLTSHERMMAIVERREKASKNAPWCPSCNREQVQLINWFKYPLQFKCRVCKHKFEVTPDGN